MCQLDASAPLTSSFEEYRADYARGLCRSSRSQRFAIEILSEDHIGDCAYFNIDNVKKDTELGIMIGDRAYWNQGYGTDAVVTLIHHIFLQTRLERIYLKTLDWNIRAQKCFEKCGFIPCGQIIRGDRSFIIMETYRSSLSSNQDRDE